MNWKRAILSLAMKVGSLYSLYLLFFGNVTEGLVLATITFGDTAAPNDIAMYFDSVFTQSLKNARGLLVDNIGRGNAFLHMLLKSDQYESTDGGTYFEEELMYALSPMESYDGADELSTVPTDGITAAQFEIRQLATPVNYTMKQVIQNKRKIINLVKSKMTQMRMGIEEGFAVHFMQGSGAGAIETAKVNAVNGSLSILPLPLLVKFDPTTSTLIGNLNQSTATWWRNITKTADATYTATQFMAAWLNFYNTCALGSGGPPEIMLCDQVTYEMASMALYDKYRRLDGDNGFPFTNIRVPFGNGKSLLVMDDKVPDVFSNTLTYTYGSMYALNSKFFKLRYIEGRDFEMLVDENGKTFKKPINQDTRVGHCAWMGQATVNNRRKHGIWGKIPRTLT